MNIFKEGKELWKKKGNGNHLTEEEEKLLGAAMIPLMQLPEYNDVPISEGLDELAKLGGGKSMTAFTEIEVKELEEVKDDLEEAIAKLRKTFKRFDRGDEDSDLFLEAINMLESVRDDYLSAWLEEFEMRALEDNRKLEAWKLWATR